MLDQKESPTLGVFIPLKDFSFAPIAYCSVIDTFYMPTACVIFAPELVVPRTARAYVTNLTRYCDAVRLLEVWEDAGDDGHVDYVHTGYVFVEPSIFPRNEKDHKQYLPLRVQVIAKYGYRAVEEFRNED